MKKVHLIGIGGIGISAIAKYFIHQNYQVSGSDMHKTTITDKLQKMGVEITIPHNSSAVKNQDLIIHSAVIKENNPEMVEAKRKDIPIFSRKEILPHILKDKKVYSVAGAHGKSTTTAILSSIFNDSTAIIGAESKEFYSNFRAGNGNRVIFEADESDASFVKSNPYCAIVTNAEPEHMEYYNYDLDKFYNTYVEFLEKGKKRIINGEDEFISTLDIDAVRLFPSKDIKNIRYELKDGNPITKFSLMELGEFEVYGFGNHIAIDASLAILSALNELNIEEIRQNIKNYKGIKKRFDVLKSSENYVLIDDYAHHPTEIRETIKSVKIYSELKKLDELIAIWQPHKYSRTVHNLKEFVNCFKGVDKLIILPVWSAGEKKIEINFEKEFQEYNPFFFDTFEEAKKNLKLKNGAVIGFGAGDITYQLRRSV